MEPEDIEKKEFLISLRGYDREEVDAFLRELALQVRALKSGAAAPEAPADQESMYRRVGEETAGILMAAEEAGRQIRERAQREAAELVTDARARADDVARQSAADRQEAEEDLRKLREARTLLATQLQDVRQRLDEVISRLTGPIEAPPAPKRARPKKAEAPPPAVPAPKPAAPSIPAPPIPALPPPAAPPPPPPPAPAPSVPAAPARVASPTAAKLQELLEEARREREQARREIQEVLVQSHAPPVPAPAVAPAEVAHQNTRVGVVPATTEVLARRDRTLAGVPAAAARRLKLVLQEDQNDLLDRIRTSRGKGSFDQDVSPPDLQLSRFREALREFLGTAFVAGRRLAGGEGEGKSATAVGDLIAKQIVSPLRREVGRVVEAGMQAEDTATSIAGRAGDVFRVWKGVRTELLGEGLAYSAFHHGMLDAWREQRTAAKRWIASPDEGDCPKDICASNAAAGAVSIDDPFPSGHLAPPAHGGCTCALVSEQG